MLRAAQGWYGSEGGFVGARAVWEVVEVECVAQCADRQSVWGKALDRLLSGKNWWWSNCFIGNFIRRKFFEDPTFVDFKFFSGGYRTTVVFLPLRDFFSILIYSFFSFLDCPKRMAICNFLISFFTFIMFLYPY